jgi:hypothetical protein
MKISLFPALADGSEHPYRTRVGNFYQTGVGHESPAMSSRCDWSWNETRSEVTIAGLLVAVPRHYLLVVPTTKIGIFTTWVSSGPVCTSVTVPTSSILPVLYRQSLS